MKSSRILLLLIAAALLFSTSSYSQVDCPKQGLTKEGEKISSAKDRRLNRGKNRSAAYNSNYATLWSLSEIINMEDVEDEDLYIDGDYRYLEGYIVEYIEEGPESCNCYQASKAEKTGDVHIYIGKTKASPKSECVIVEITPDFKKRYPDYEDILNTDEKVRVFGYMLYDHQHRANATMTCTSCSSIWRKTNWELHPVLSIETL